jgi:hypothetical protein
MGFRRHLTCIVSIFVAVLALWPVGAISADSTWRQSTFEDFRQGMSDDGGDYIDRSAGRTDEVIAGRYIQYRAVFLSKDGSNYPVLREVVIEL